MICMTNNCNLKNISKQLCIYLYYISINIMCLTIKTRKEFKKGEQAIITEPLKRGKFLKTSMENYVQTRDILVRLCSRIFSLMAFSLSLKLKPI